MKYLREYRYEIIAALCGGVVMILELVGARMVAPYFGTSTYVWTAMIGVILGALSLGYWYGGRLADRHADDNTLMRIIAFAALGILFAVLMQAGVLRYISAQGGDLRIQAVMAGLILFAPAATLLGVVSPYVAKLRISGMSTAGQSIGRLYAAGTVGSIAGTFLAGYWLIAWFGNRTLGLSLVLVLLAVSFLALPTRWLWQRLAIAGAALLFLLVTPSAPGFVADVDTAYSRYQIVDGGYGASPEARLLMTDRFSIQSAQVVGKPHELPVEYIRRFNTALQVHGAERIAVIGGGVYTFPTVAALDNSKLKVDAVEIDTALNDIAKEYFGYQPLPNLTIINQDGRLFLSKAKATTYDIVYLDAFSSLTPPFHLVTKEAVTVAKQSLKPNGISVANVVAEATDDPYLSAMFATYQDVFKHVLVYPTTNASPTEIQNLLFVMSDHPLEERRYTAALGTQPISVKKGAIMTDDFAPVEQLIAH